MSNEALAEDKELDDLKAQIEQQAEIEKDQAAKPEVTETPSPEPVVSQAAEAVGEQNNSTSPGTQTESKPEKAQDDPLKWAEKKGFKTPEDMARALLQKEQEFHQSRQKQNGNAAPPPPPMSIPDWQPSPQMGYGYPPPQYAPPPRVDERELAARLFPGINPDDAKVFIPAMFEVAGAAARQERAAIERQFGTQISQMQRQTERNNELMQLMQDPAFRNETVQREIHAVLDSDPAIYQRERMPHTAAFNQALANLARKQLQQGVGAETVESRGNMPPVTAGGGNGSANTVRRAPTEREMERWTPEQMKAYLSSNGRIVPKS